MKEAVERQAGEGAEAAVDLEAPGPPGPSLSQEGLLSMLRAGLESPEQRAERPAAALLMLLALSGFVGITGAHLGGAWAEPLLGIAPRRLLFGGSMAALAAAAGLAARVGRRGLAALALMLLAYLLGNLLSGGAHRLAEPLLPAAADAPALRFIASRLLYAAAVALPMFLVYALVFRGGGEFHLGVGDWRVKTRLARKDEPRSWAATLGGFVVVAAVPIFLLMQYQVGFGPLVGGRLPALLLPIVAMALANAFAEELLFRGLLQGAAVRAVGAAWGIWMVGVLFGLHHWGMSFQLLTSLPGALLIGAGSVLFAKSVLETRGLAWAVCAHAMINVGLFSAFYVAV